jgi:hypothetical protein
MKETCSPSADAERRRIDAGSASAPHPANERGGFASSGRGSVVSSVVGNGTDTLFDAATATSAGRDGHSPAWMAQAACRGADAPCMFADRWGIGRGAARQRAAALAACRSCPVRRECGIAALADVDAGMSLYGVLCGVEFTDVTPCRQERDVARLRVVVAGLDVAQRAARQTDVLAVSALANSNRSMVRSAHA